MRLTLTTSTVLALLVLFAPARADYDLAVAAAQRNDVATAFKELQAAAQANDERAFAPLARMYLGGVGTKADERAGLAWAQKAAAKGIADGQFLIYALTVERPELNFFDSQGRLDQQRYRALAARPISEREDEMNAYDLLTKAAAQGHPEAALRLAGVYADNVGEGNRKRAEELLDKLPKRPPLFENLRKALGELDALGPTLVTVRLADEAIPAAAKVAQAAAVERDKTKADCKAVKPVRAQRLGAINKPIWLPLVAPEMKTAYLMSGEWRERWTFDVCGTESVVQVMFVADGLGGARYTAEKER
jgi:TPR repeat protein